MDSWKSNTAVALTVFSQPTWIKKVFAAIREVKPPQLLIIADAPRPNKQGEAERCAEALKIVEDGIDWDCEVIRNYSPVNLGPRKRLSSGISWVFENVEEAIILEHDCLPNSYFFRFCEELLAYYRHDNQVMTISGENVQFGRQRTEYSYYFSRYFRCWGWASWRRAWQYYDIDMKLWPQVRDSGMLKDILIDPRAVKYWTNIFQDTYDNKLNTWDYQWIFASWLRGGLTVIPEVNLVSNIGFGSEATNTTHAKSEYGNQILRAIDFPLKHPPFLVSNRAADDFTQNTAYNPNTLTRIKAKINRDLPAIGRFI